MKALTIIALLISNCYLGLAAIELQAQSVTLDANQVTPPSASLDITEAVTKLYQTGDDSCRAAAKWSKEWSGGSWSPPPSGTKMTTIKGTTGEFWAEHRFPLEVKLLWSTCPVNTVTFRFKLIVPNQAIEVYQKERGRESLLATYSYNHLMAALGEPGIVTDYNERRLQGVSNNQNPKSAMVTLKCTGCSISKIEFIQSKEGHSIKTDQYSFGFESKQSRGTVLPAVEVAAFPPSVEREDA